MISRLKIKTRRLSKISGFSIIEMLVAMGIMLILGATGTTAILHSFSINRAGDEKTEATLYAQEGIEAVRSIKNQGWSDFFLTPAASNNCSVGCGVNSTTAWAFKTGADTNGRFTRTIVVADTQRDEGGEGNIVATGGTDDPDTKKITSTVTWAFSSAITNTVELVGYLSQWGKDIISAGCNWGTGLEKTGFYGSAQATANDVFIVGSRAYLVTDNSAGAEFFILNITNPTSPAELSSLELGTNINRVYVSGNYAYLATDANSEEMIVVSITGDVATKIDSFDAWGNDNANDVYISGNYAYLVRDQGSRPELYVIPVSDPANLPLYSDSSVGKRDISGNAYGVTVSGDFVYVVTAINASELVVFDIGDSSGAAPNNPLDEGTADLAGDSDARDIASGTDLYIGKDVDAGNNEFFVYSKASTPALIGSLNIGSGVSAVSLSGNYVLLGADSASEGFKIVDITTPASPSLLTTVNIGSAGLGVASSGCYAYIATADTAEELKVVSAAGPSPTPTVTPTTGPTPTTEPTPTTGPTPTTEPTATPSPTPVLCPEEKDCLEIVTTGAYISGTDLLGLTIRRTQLPIITVETMTVSWTQPGINITQVRIDSSTLWSSKNGVPSGSTLDLSPDYQPETVSSPINRLRFSGNLTSGYSFTIIFNMADGSSKTINLSL